MLGSNHPAEYAESVSSRWSDERKTLGGHAFISYVREDSHNVDELQRRLEEAGVRVWRDTANLWPGEDWRAKIRHAINDNALAFIVCFSHASLARDKSYQNEELTLAIEQLRLRRPEDPWLFPVRFDDCDIPDRDVGGGRTLTSIQRADLFGDRYAEGSARLIAAVVRILGQQADADAAGLKESPVLVTSNAPHMLEKVDEASRESVPRNLPQLHDSKRRLSVLIEMIDMSPDSLDPQASEVHQKLVMPVYELMRTEVAQACGPRWDTHDRRRFTDTYRAAANKWPAYREALAELERARHLRMSVNDAMVRLERPRSDYIAALLTFYDEFASTLDLFFPS